MTRIKPLKLASGRILLPLYSDGFNMAIVAISDDDGDTWHASLPIVGRGMFNLHWYKKRMEMFLLSCAIMVTLRLVFSIVNLVIMEKHGPLHRKQIFQM